MGDHCVGGNGCVTSGRNEQGSHLKHIHIGVFFDGTNNNMVQQAHYKTFKGKKEGGIFKRESDPYSGSSKQKESYDKVQDAIKNKNYEELEKLQIEAHIDSKTIHEDKVNSYSNIAILHSALNHKTNTDDSIYYNIYVEGSGAKNLACGDSWLIKQYDEKAGLGFGVGKNGVASLVAKACNYVHSYLECRMNTIDEATKIHFYVFGFSRGATCARLFAQLATREEGSKLICEPELLAYTKYGKQNDRLAFCEKNYLTNDTSGIGVINRNNVFVEYLGIFDTVSSIGILMQEDGSVNPLRDTLKNGILDFVTGTKGWVCHYNTDKDNYHYNNAHDYGLFINNNAQMKDVFHICAADEYRENFALVNIGKKIDKGLEIIIPGCHADVGGSYIDYVDEGNNERVLYRFVPRIGDIYKDDENADVAKAPRYKKFKRMTFLVSEKTRESIRFINPLDSNSYKPLTADGLADAGWIDKSWSSESGPVLYLDEGCEHKCTIRFADSGKSDNRCVKFTHNTKGYYSNIPLRMMLARCCDVKLTGNGIIKELFNSETIKQYFPYPSDLREYAEKLVKLAKVNNGKRYWVTAGSNYYSDAYRKLRLKYLHFTASCQIIDWKFKFNNGYEVGDLDLGNIANECNYTSDGKICRIMYDGTNNEINSAQQGVKILQLNSGDVAFEHISVDVNPKLYSKR